MSESKKKEEPTKPAVQGPPVVVRQDFVDWLESLWGPGKTITRLEVRRVRDRNGNIERLGHVRPPYPFAPNAEAPSRSDLVTLSNEILFVTQTDCNTFGKKRVYGVIAYQFGSADDYVGLFGIKCRPKENNSEGDAADDEGGLAFSGGDEDGGDYVLPPGPAGALLAYSLHQNRQALADRRYFVKQNKELTEAVIEHLATSNDKKDAIIAAGFERQIKLMEATEALISRDHERKLKARWTEVGVGAAEKTAEMVLGLLPPLVNRVAGKEVIQTRTSIESVVVATFIKSVTPEQAKEAFGYCGEGQPRYEGCIFTQAQSELFGAIAGCQVGPERIGDLIPGSGSPLALDMAQLARAEKLFDPQQLWPIKDLINQWMQRKFAASAQSVPSSPKP